MAPFQVIPMPLTKLRTKKDHYIRKKRVSANQTIINQGLAFDNANLDAIASLLEDPSTILKQKMARVAALHQRWEAEDKKIFCTKALKQFQRQRCMGIGDIVFGFSLQKAKIDAIWTLFYEQHDLLLVARTGFGKSLIFQLFPFMLKPTGVVIILIPLKLL